MNKWTPETNQMVLRRVGKTGEECAELSKVCSRITIQGLHGVDPESGLTNLEALAKEVADVMAQCEVTIEKMNLPRKFIEGRAAKKVAQMAEWEALFELPNSKVTGA
jgi:NTP pyrophosphatase (non-canonical NTP hydrolase)